MSGGTQDYLQIDLPAPQTSADVRVRFGTTLPSTPFEIFVQLIGADGSVGAPTSTSKEPRPGSNVVVTAVVYSTFGPNATGTGPGIYGPPVAGATVSTSLDSVTATTNANGVFELRTNTPAQPSGGPCFTLTISAPGFPTYSAPNWKTNGQSPDVHKISLRPAMPLQGTTSGCS
jgi:hypothetical protein